jgi:hypothetical protein
VLSDGDDNRGSRATAAMSKRTALKLMITDTASVAWTYYP